MFRSSSSFLLFLHHSDLHFCSFCHHQPFFIFFLSSFSLPGLGLPTPCYPHLPILLCSVSLILAVHPSFVSQAAIICSSIGLVFDFSLFSLTANSSSPWVCHLLHVCCRLIPIPSCSWVHPYIFLYHFHSSIPSCIPMHSVMDMDSSLPPSSCSSISRFLSSPLLYNMISPLILISNLLHSAFF